MSGYEFCQATTEIQIADCLKVRRAVFGDEKGIDDELVVDGQDDKCQHFLGLYDSVMHEVLLKHAIATARILPINGTARVQRVAVLAEHRCNKAGLGLMQCVIDFAREADFYNLELGSQIGVMGFYEKLGFRPIGERYMHIGIEHQDMRLIL